MSTILEALKKSEQERKRNNVPTLSDMPVPQEKSKWPLIVIAILSLVLALVIGVLISQWLSGPAASTAAPTQAQQTSPASSSSEVSPQALADAALQDVDVNVISYSEDPNTRFVMLDGKLFRENDFVRAGLKVEQIQPNAVIFNHRGHRVTRTP